MNNKLILGLELEIYFLFAIACLVILIGDTIRRCPNNLRDLATGVAVILRVVSLVVVSWIMLWTCLGRIDILGFIAGLPILAGYVFAHITHEQLVRRYYGRKRHRVEDRYFRES